MGRLALLAGGLAIYATARVLVGARRRRTVRLDDGRRVRLLSAMALVNRSAHDLLALEYVPTVRSSDLEALSHEARTVLRLVASRPEYAGCRTAVVTAGERVLTFHRFPAEDWSQIGDSSSPPPRGAPEGRGVHG